MGKIIRVMFFAILSAAVFADTCPLCSVEVLSSDTYCPSCGHHLATLRQPVRTPNPSSVTVKPFVEVQPSSQDVEQLFGHIIPFNVNNLVLFSVEHKISVRAQLVDLFLNAQINVIYRGPRDNIIQEYCAGKIEKRDQIVSHVEDASCQINQQHSEQRSGIDHHHKW